MDFASQSAGGPAHSKTWRSELPTLQQQSCRFGSWRDRFVGFAAKGALVGAAEETDFPFHLADEPERKPVLLAARAPADRAVRAHFRQRGGWASRRHRAQAFIRFPSNA